MTIRSAISAFAFLTATSALSAKQVGFSEVMYHPATGKPEFIEVWNYTMTPLDMANWRMTRGLQFTFPDFSSENPMAHILRPKERILLSSGTAADTRAAYPDIPADVRIFGPWTGALDNAGETIELSDKNGTSLCELDYNDSGRWSPIADGTGHSLVLIDEAKEIDDFHNWKPSLLAGGSPGRAESDVTDPSAALRGLRLSEVHFDSLGTIDWVEVANRSGGAVDLTGLQLSADAERAISVTLGGTVAAGGYASQATPFGTDNDGSAVVYLWSPGGHVLDCAPVTRRPGRPSVQSVEGDWREWYSSTTDTRDAANAPTGLNSSIVINEVMFDQPGNFRDGEFIELYNRGTEPVNLGGWQFEEAVDFAFPPGTTIAPGGYLVVASSVDRLKAIRPGVNAIGNWSGSLSAYGEMIRLEDEFRNLVDIVDYNSGGDWPRLTAGDGSSMELVHPDMDNARSSAWRDSDESAKGEFRTFTVTAPFRQLRTMGGATSYKELHFHLVGDSHIELRNIALRPAAGGENLLTNVGTMSTNGNSSTGWLAQGTHWQSYMDGSGVLHLISTGHGDNRANRAEIDCTEIQRNEEYTLTFEARWVYGNPRLIAQTWDHSIGGSFLVPIPDNLGTPGAVNSVFQANPLPQVDNLLHSPAVPKPADPVVVTARVTSAAPLAAVRVMHREDDANNANPWTATAMNDAGTAGDAVAGDGIFSATVTSYQTNGRIAQFYVEAETAAGGKCHLPRLGPDEPGMWIVDSRTNLPTTLRKARYIVSAYHRAASTTSTGQSARFNWAFPRLSNHYFPCTFIDDEKTIYYGAGIRKTGSPWTRTDAATLDRARWSLPRDRRFRGRERFSYDNDPTQGRTLHNRLTRYYCYLFGIPSHEGEFVHMILNNGAPRVSEEMEPSSKDFLDRIYEDGSNGQLLRTDDEWWFDDNWNRQNRDADWSYKNTDEAIRYHTEWMCRSREWDYDYAPFTSAIRLISGNQFTPAEIDRVMDARAMAAMAAIRGYIMDWDSITLERGKNGFMYRRKDDGLWMLLQWDSDLAFQSDRVSGIVVGSLPRLRNYFDKPHIRRLLNYYLNELITKYTKDSPRVLAWLDAEEQASTAYASGKSTYVNWFNRRENRIRQEINLSRGGGPANSLSAPFELTSPPAATEADVLELTGTAPPSVYTVDVEGMGGTVAAFVNQQVWTLGNVALREGANNLTIRGLDSDGNVVMTTTASIAKTGNSAPAVRLAIEPADCRLTFGQPLVVDDSGSFDPEGTALTREWSVSPADGVTLPPPGSSPARFLFSKGGVYTISLTTTDGAGKQTVVSREVLVSSAEDLAVFETRVLPAWLTAENVGPVANSSPDAWYSLETRDDVLTVRLNSAAGPRPLTATAPQFPVLWRDLPDESGFSLETDLTLTGRRFGTFATGMIVEFEKDGAVVRYALVIEDGTQIAVKRATPGGEYENAEAPVPATGERAEFRITREGGQVSFRVRNGSDWTTLHAAGLPAGTRAVRGGILVASAAGETVEVAFDTLGFSDSTASNPVVAHLRVTEIMYNPAGQGGAEFIELTNTGTSPLSLAGVTFVQGDPFDEVILGNESLAPGEFVVLTDNEEAFRATYGQGPRILAVWPGGNLSNGGEDVMIVDAAGNPILNFGWSDIAPWPVAADGAGPSLEIVSTEGDYNDPFNWRASAVNGGTPGTGTTTSPVTDSDGDGQSDEAELVAGTDPNDPASVFRLSVEPAADDGAVSLHWQAAAGRTWHVEAGPTTEGPWTTIHSVSTTDAEPLTWEVQPEAGVARRFFRIRVTQP